MIGKKDNREAGFTLIEIVIAVAIVAIFAAVLSPMVFRHLEDAKVGVASTETETIGTAILTYYKDVGKWPYTDENGPSGNGIDRLISSTKIAEGSGPEAGSAARKWGSFGTAKQLGDYLYSNNADDNTGSNAGGETDQDWPTSGAGAWRGPYIESYTMNDPWGNAYVVNCRYFPSGGYDGGVIHKVIVLSAGPNGKWETSFKDNVTEAVAGDDWTCPGFVDT